MNQVHAARAFAEKHAEIQRKLAILQSMVNDHMGVDPDRINWADVGTAEHVSMILGEIIACLEA